MADNTTNGRGNYTGVTVGIVVDTNDPQEDKRVRVIVPAYGDSMDGNISDLPWAVAATPFGGTLNNSDPTRGPNNDTTNGPVAYGMWIVPKVGAKVLVTCIDGDAMNRVYIGCISPSSLGHTIPHGRFVKNDTGDQDGPLSSHETPIQPLYRNYTAAFGPKTNNYEWSTRGADYSAAGLNMQFFGNDVSEKNDDIDTQYSYKDGSVHIVKQGYSLSQIHPDLTYDDTTGKNYDSSVYAWTTPGFHSISMDDRAENCRIRVRTTSGHQVILDDTNERIYISTAEGANWLEMDQDGNVDMYSEQRVNIRSAKDLNLTADSTVRIYGGDGIHLYSPNEIRAQAVNDIHLKGQNIRQHASNTLYLEADSALNVKSPVDVKITASGTLHLSGTTTNVTSTGSDLNLSASGNIVQSAIQVVSNGPGATSAVQADDAAEQPAFWTNRVPDHEPWARTSTASDTTHDPLYSYDDPMVGREDKTRNPLWRR